MLGGWEQPLLKCFVLSGTITAIGMGFLKFSFACPCPESSVCYLGAFHCPAAARSQQALSIERCPRGVARADALAVPRSWHCSGAVFENPPFVLLLFCPARAPQWCQRDAAGAGVPGLGSLPVLQPCGADGSSRAPWLRKHQACWVSGWDTSPPGVYRVWIICIGSGLGPSAASTLYSKPLSLGGSV